MASPGPAAAQAFALGIRSAAVAGLGALGWLYWTDVLSLAATAYALVALFPVYLLVVASVLSVWLGYDRDTTDLRPVSR